MPTNIDKDISVAVKPKRRNSNSVSFYESLWKIITFAIIPCSAVLLMDAIKFQNWASENLKDQARWSDLWVTAVSAVIIFLIRKTFQVSLFRTFYQIIEDKHQGEERIVRTQRVVKWAYDFIYYGGMTWFVYNYLGDAYFIPGMVFGKGDCDTMKGYPDIPVMPYLRTYYLVQMGSHLCSLLEQIYYKRKDAKFYEYFLHHYLAFALIFYSFLLHIWALGALVMIVHDISDIFLSFGRALEGQKYFKPNWFLFIYFGLTTFAWAWCRTIVFPLCPMYSAIKDWGKWPEVWDIVKYNYGFQVVMLGVLLIMNIYWVAILGNMFISALVKKKVNNTYDPNILKNKEQ